MERRLPIDGAAALLSVVACLLVLAGIPASVGLRQTPAFRLDFPATETAGGAALDVTVRAPSGGLLSGATVRVFSARGDRYVAAATARTDGAGKALLGGLPPGAAWVLFEAPGHARSSTALVLGGRRSVTVSLESARRLKVTVEDEDKKPIPGATVLVTGKDALPFGALTDLDGSAQFGRLGEGPWKVRAMARSYEPGARSDVVADTSIVLTRAGALDVFVTDRAGAAVADATVLVAGPSLWPARALQTGKDGHAHVTGLEQGAYDVKASRGSLVSPTEGGLHVERGKTHDVSLVLAAGRMVSFVVTDGEGDHPLVVPNADVTVVEGGVSSFPIQGRTNGFGKVVLGPLSNEVAVASAAAEGFVTRATVEVPEVVTDDVRLPLLRGATLVGEVVDAEGHPIEGATAEIIGTDLDGGPIALTPAAAEFQRLHFAWALEGPQPLLPAGELGVMPGPIPPIPTESGDTGFLPGRRMPPPVPAEPWVTGRDGSFRAGSIPPGRVAALVRHPSYVEATSEMVTLGPGATASVHVVLRPGGALEGVVVDDIGLPVSGVRVEVSAAQGTLSRSSVTADDGTFAFSALPAEVFVTLSRAEDPTRPVLRKRILVPDGGTAEQKLVLPAPLPAIEVDVEDESGRPIPMAQISVLSVDPERPIRVTEFTDEAGRASVIDAAGLSLRIAVEAPSYARWVKQFDRAPERLTAELVSSVLVEGRVTAVRGRQEVSGATVELLADGRRQVVVSDTLGRYRFADVTPGRAHLAVSHPDFAPSELDVVIRSTGRSDRSFDVDPIDLDEPGSIEGRVVNGEGAPVAGARVGIGTVGSYLPVIATVLTTTSKLDGTFRLERVRPGSVDVEAVLAGVGRARAAKVAVTSGRTTSDVTLTLSAAADDTDAPTGAGVAITLEVRRTPSGRAVVIVDVARGSEAESAGLSRGDVLQSIDRAVPASVDEARGKLSGPEGSDVVVEVSRGGERIALRVRRELLRR